MTVTIAQATIRELEDAAALFDEYRVFYDQESDLEGAKAFLFDRLEHGESVIFLARDDSDGAAVGFMQLYPLFSSVSMKRIWLLNDLYVRESHRGKQVGKALLEAAREYAVLTKSKGLEIATQVTNLRAQKVYLEHGYVLDEEFFHYYMLV
ncbi:GNAT family N-acetyltransferase [Paenibacillus sp. YN15]|uniref:GNAT family N-acetyltransferase n=1 Tax=Paenibacillus sp. YN15 TaxID=1742774 RepID=UPI000DCF58B4|nr:GNAT family N-acetyltransferase [Paenibacillus sp. YN15]